MNKIPVIILFFIISCNSNKKNFPELSSKYIFDDTLTGEVLPKVIKIEHPFRKIYYTKFGILMTNKFGSGFIQLYDTLNGGRITEEGKLGNGPGEYINPVATSYNPVFNAFIFRDFHKGVIGTAIIGEKKIEIFDNLKFNNKIVEACNLNDSLFVALSVFDGHYLSLVSKKGGIYDKIPHRLFKIESLDYTSHHYSSIIENIEKSKTFIISDINFPIVKAYTFNNNKLNLIWSIEFYKSFYSIKNGRLIIDRDRHILSFHSITTSEKYIYLLTYGITANGLINRDNVKIGKTTMLVLDLNGKLIRTILLDKCIHSASVSPDDRVLYGLTSNPDILLVKYKLN